MHKYKIVRALASSLLLLALFVPAAYAITGIGDVVGLSPFWNYKTIETRHFRITFPEELTETAQKTANYLEEAHSLLAPALYWEASYRVNVNIIDNQDSENGLTAATLRLGLTLYVTPPDNWMSIAYYDNWLRELCIHEYTHFLNMDATRELYKAARIVFGDVLLPNSFWPSWMLEGLAVYDETRYTRVGRGRSPYYDMVLRAAVEENVLDSRKFITLDKINGPNPYFPGGETAYLFGYELMNQAAREAKSGPSFDNGGLLSSGEDALGIMSKRSSWRVPFFINGNLENITGKDWYATWDDFVSETRAHADSQLKRIRSAAVTRFRKITTNSFEAYGPRVSPDGRWIVYTLDGLDDISGLYIKDRKNGKTSRLMDKIAGAAVAFSKDGRYLFESRLHRIRTYYFYSDIEVLNLDDGSTHWLTFNQRARDPSLSPDERWISFTRTENTTTKLVLGRLILNEDRYSLGETKTLYAGEKYDRVSTPQFSPDGTQIAFSVHHNGKVGEDVLLYDVNRRTLTPVAADGVMNRYPAWDPHGSLYFVSDKTGVDNLYLYRPGKTARMMSNFETGVAFPNFSPHLGDDKYLATVFSTHGWDVAEVDLPSSSYSPEALKVAPPSAPPIDEKSMDHAESRTYEVSDYSLWPTILPRAWAPILSATNQGSYLGGSITGFDQVDRHRYALLGAYDTFVKKGDLYAIYDNRLLGATIEGVASLYTAFESAAGNTLVAYGRTQSYTLAAYYTFAWTYSSLTPRISYNFNRQTNYVVNPNGPDIQTGATALVPQPDFSLTYSDVESSRLAVVPERGQTLMAGVRAYLNSGENDYKEVVDYNANVELGSSHVVIAPRIQGSWASHVSGFQNANVRVQGRYSNQIINSLAATSFDQLSIRGYPLQAYYTRAATVASGDIRFPIWRILAGPGTDPLFLENLWGFGFGEAAYFPDKDQNVPVLPSAGGGIHLGVDVAQYIPLDMSVQYHYGFRASVGGTGEVFFQLGLNIKLY